nr:tumor necrosis factor receptor superfamily member wengen isoform X1 [Helicoverpa armigera]
MSRKEVMLGDIPKLCLLVATLALGSVAGSGACERGLSWWDRQRGTCVPCTRCDPAKRLVVRYPCEIHRDTICQSLYEAQISPFNTPKQVLKKNNEISELLSSDDEYEYVDYDSEVTSRNDVSWDLQTTSLSVAASGCIVFFVVVLVMSLYHARQWRVIKRALKSDVQDLTAKLKLMEAGGETTAEPVVAADHHIYCNIHNLGKEALLDTSPFYQTDDMECLDRNNFPHFWDRKII